MPELTLEIYAHVRAALAEEHPLGQILKLEGVEIPDWTKGDVGWKTRLATDKAELARFEKELALAEDWLDRDVTPLADELPAWVGFLDSFTSHPSPFDLVIGAGLRMTDVARLRRKWAKKMKEDASLERVATELRRRPLLMPEVKVGPSVLKRSRNGKAVSVAPQAAIAEAPLQVALASGPESAGSVQGIWLDQLAAMLAEVRVRPSEADAIAKRQGLEGEPALRAVEASFRERFAREPALLVDFKRLLAHYEHKVRGRAAGPSLASSPFGPPVALTPPSAQALPAPSAQVPPVRVVEASQLPSVRPVAALASTAALPIDRPLGATLPFDTSRAPDSSIRKASAKKPPKHLGETTGPTQAPKLATMPFKIERKLGQAAVFSAPSDSHAPSKKEESPAPPEAKIDKKPAERKLTLQQHASLCVELAVAREQAPKILLRYGVTAVEKEEHDALYRAELAGSSELQRAWNDAYRRYFDWMTKKTS